MKKYFILLILTIFTSISFSQTAKAPKVKRLLEMAALNIKSLSGRAESTTIIYNKPQLKKFKFWAKQPNKMRIEYTYPDKMKGTIIVTDGKTLWRYYPALKKASSMPIAKKREKATKTFDKELGFISQLIAESEQISDFWEKNELKVLGEEKIGKTDCYKVELILKKKEEGVSSTQKLWIDKNTGLTLKVEFAFLDITEIIVFHYKEINKVIPDETFVYKEKEEK